MMKRAVAGDGRIVAKVQKVPRSASTRERSRALDDYMEVARATRAAKLVPAYNPVVVFSLSAAGHVRQAMTFRRPEDDFTHGSGWNWKRSGETLDAFTAWAVENGLALEVRPKPKRINYEKPVSMRGGPRPRPAGEAGEATTGAPAPRRRREKREQTDDDKRVEAQVIALRLEGLSYKKIEEKMGRPGKRGFWAMTIIKRAEQQAGEGGSDVHS